MICHHHHHHHHHHQITQPVVKGEVIEEEVQKVLEQGELTYHRPTPLMISPLTLIQPLRRQMPSIMWVLSILV